MRDFNADGLLAGRPYIDVHAQDAVQKVPIGHIYERYGRRWRYSRAGADMLAHRGAFNAAIIPGDTGGSAFGGEADLYGAHVAGIREVLWENATAWPVDYFQGGWAVFFRGAESDIQTIRISGNDLGDGTSCKLYLDEPLAFANDGTYGVTCYANPYYNTNQTGSATSPVVCVPMCNVTSGYFYWGQTKGPCWVTPTAYGPATLKVWHGDGCIKDAANGTTETLQIAGYMLNRDVGTYGDGLIQLMLE